MLDAMTPGRGLHQNERELEALCERSAERVEGAVARAEAAGWTQPPAGTLTRATRVEARLIEVRKKRRQKGAAAGAIADAVANPAPFPTPALDRAEPSSEISGQIQSSFEDEQLTSTFEGAEMWGELAQKLPEQGLPPAPVDPGAPLSRIAQKLADELAGDENF